INHKCPQCGSLLWFMPKIQNYKYNFNKPFSTFWDFYFSFPQIEKEFIVTLDKREGGTPCKESERIGEILGLKNLYFKDETQNPTNSFKDRSAALLISHARSWEYNKVVCASNGNQGASIAAYASLEGMKCVNIIPSEIDIGKKAQMIAYNSEIIINGDLIDDALELALDKKYNEHYQCTSEYNPLTIEAQKTIGFEIYQKLGVPDWMIIPMGSGELLVSLWKSYNELRESNIIQEVPKLIGVQSQISSPIVDGFFKRSTEESGGGDTLKSLALGILVKKPIFKDLAIRCIKESKGSSIAIPENLILNSIDELIRNEGIFAEPSSALTLAALQTLNQQGLFDANEKIVCIITGSGLKAPYVLDALSSRTKTAGMGSLLSTKLKILTQISLAGNKGIYGTKIKDMLGSISVAAVYQHLKELEEKQLIYREKSGKNVYYRINDNGKKVLEALETLINLF
ncbi:MAG: pyridoxal-phosphate dependent enzyme, partial [Candidatus Heimdallarchaeota archaeon]